MAPGCVMQSRSCSPSSPAELLMEPEILRALCPLFWSLDNTFSQESFLRQISAIILMEGEKMVKITDNLKLGFWCKINRSESSKADRRFKGNIFTCILTFR